MSPTPEHPVPCFFPLKAEKATNSDLGGSKTQAFCDRFPSPLRDYPCTSPRGEASGPAGPDQWNYKQMSAHERHVERQRAGRGNKHQDVSKMRISNGRWDVVTDPWSFTSEAKRSCKVMMPLAPTSRSIAGLQFASHAREAASEVAIAQPKDENGAWARSDSMCESPRSPRGVRSRTNTALSVGQQSVISNKSYEHSAYVSEDKVAFAGDVRLNSGANPQAACDRGSNGDDRGRAAAGSSDDGSSEAKQEAAPAATVPTSSNRVFMPSMRGLPLNVVSKASNGVSTSNLSSAASEESLSLRRIGSPPSATRGVNLHEDVSGARAAVEAVLARNKGRTSPTSAAQHRPQTKQAAVVPSRRPRVGPSCLRPGAP